MSILFTFPGQGAQQPGMLHALPDHPETRRALAEAGDVLDADPLLLDTAQALASTYAVQLCLLIAGVAMARILGAQQAGPDMVAGLSIGAYPAAVIAGALDYADALRLVERRARLMESAYPRGYGMAVINGLDRDQLAPLIARVHTASHPVYLANLNAPQQMVIAGADHALRAVMLLAIECGATRVERLAVNVPSHCPLLDAAAAAMTTAFSEIAVQRPQLSYLSTAAIRPLSEPTRIADDLANNMARQLHWSDTVRLAWERGARLALEMPSGSVLSDLSAPIFTDGLAIACDHHRLDTLLALIARERLAL
ncbi:malonate decarboxylase subunit epsilon [Paraherbaspirillum soli]|uniref:Malonyl CoA-acyl carrier protein transacylase n=1 Tax=Paraherbaspirillum soli TaxID=631222 RepID=A0ABW0MDH8_9BURK